MIDIRLVSRRVGAAALGLAVAATATACSSSGNPSSGGTAAAGGGASGATTSSTASCIAAADKFLAPYLTFPTTLPASLTPLKEKPKPGLLIAIAIANIPSQQVGVDEQKTAAAALGWQFKEISYNGTVEDLNAKMMQAISLKPTVITEGGIPAAAISQPIAAAKAAGVIVEEESTTDQPQSNPGFAAAASGAGLAAKNGKINAYMTMKDSGCKAHATVFTISGYPWLDVMVKSYKDVLESECPDCKVTVTTIQQQQLGTPAATTAIVSKLQSDPSVKYAFTTIEAVAVGLPTALNQAGISGVRIFGIVPDNTAIKALQDGTNAWWVTQNSAISGWNDVDASLRALESGGTQLNDDLPLAVLTHENAPKGSTDVPTYPANFRDLYKQLWHVG